MIEIWSDAPPDFTGSRGFSVELTIEEAGKQISNPEIGWAYVDQNQFCPSLFGMAEFRNKIVKRAAISTAEVLTGPVGAVIKHTY